MEIAYGSPMCPWDSSRWGMEDLSRSYHESVCLKKKKKIESKLRLVVCPIYSREF